MQVEKDYEELDQDIEENKVIQKITRQNFMKKVYGIVTFQLSLTTIFVILSQYKPIKNEMLKIYTQNYNSMDSIYIICSLLSLISFIILICCVPRKFPINYILLISYTFFQSICISFITIQYNLLSIILALGITSACAIGLTFYALTTKKDFTIYGGVLCAATKRDFTFCGGFLFASLFMFIIGGIITYFLGFNSDNLISCIIGGVIFSAYLVFDTQLISGEFGNKYSIDDYMIAALNIYLDLINMFIYILKIFGNKK